MKELENYILKHITPEDKLLQQLNRETHLKALYPRMLSGHLQGKILEFISKMINPSAILEIGTFTGYSALCLVKGLRDGGILHTIEANDEIIHFPKKYFRLAGAEEKIKLHVGKALEVIPQLDEYFDLVFIDADKSEYPHYYELVIDKVKTGGYILADNVLWDGKVLTGKSATDPETIGIKNFNKIIQDDLRVENLILPVRDGLSLIRKI